MTMMLGANHFSRVVSMTSIQSATRKRADLECVLANAYVLAWTDGRRATKIHGLLTADRCERIYIYMHAVQLLHPSLHCTTEQKQI